MNFIGIDPGFNGAIALVHNEELVMVADLPTIDVGRGKKKRIEFDRWNLFALLTQYAGIGPCEVCIEAVSAMPGQGITSTSRLMQGYGMLLGMTAAMRLRTELVRPAKWRTRMVGRGTDKNASRFKAMELWPERAEWFKRVKDDGRAEAALIARWHQLHRPDTSGKP